MNVKSSRRLRTWTVVLFGSGTPSGALLHSPSKVQPGGTNPEVTGVELGVRRRGRCRWSCRSSWRDDGRDARPYCRHSWLHGILSDGRDRGLGLAPRHPVTRTSRPSSDL